MIGYLDFISREWFLIAWGADTHTHAYQLRGQKQFQETRMPGLIKVLLLIIMYIYAYAFCQKSLSSLTWTFCSVTTLSLGVAIRTIFSTP